MRFVAGKKNPEMYNDNQEIDQYFERNKVVS